MRLLNVHSLEIIDFFYDDVPEYSALSHTWGVDEATFQEWTEHPNPASSTKRGFVKVQSACRVSRLEGFQYLWVDTVCIDKTSSAEVAEAINSMWAWYHDARVCYAYLEDYEYAPTSPGPERLSASRWFTRGWTLQELLAPAVVKFCDRRWSIFGTKCSLARDISRITTIGEGMLRSTSEVRRASVAQRMSWVANRKTTRKEDIAYCMLGIFDVNMPTMYGEGERAFIRLQEAILQAINDHTIFCWTWPEDTHRPTWIPVLAPGPAAFRHSGAYVLDRKRQWDNLSGYSVINNLAIKIQLRVTACSTEQCFAILDVLRSDHSSDHVVAIPLVKLSSQASWGARPKPAWRADHPSGPVVLQPLSEAPFRDLSLARPGLEPIDSDITPAKVLSSQGTRDKRLLAPINS